jgi:peptidoglycan/xylan/chitin deacetylase (PgdA/CDA1 family)
MNTRIRRLILTLLRFFGIFSLARWLSRGQLRILCYHGTSIGDQHEFEPLLFMRPEVFDRRLAAIRRQGWRVIDLETAVREFRAGIVRPNSLVLTIDDGWLSTYTGAAPILRKHQLPSTLYVTTYYAERQLDVFNVVLYYMAWKSGLSQVTLDTGYPELDGVHQIRPDARKTVGGWIEFAERSLNAAQRQGLLGSVARSLGLDLADVLAESRFKLMTPEQVADISRFNVDIQLHTHRHRLPDQSLEAMKVEIDENQRRLETWKGGPCLHFCYPSGVYTAQQSDWLEELGLASSTTCDHGHNDVGQHPHRLKRVLDRDNWSDVEFDAALYGVDRLFGRS